MHGKTKKWEKFEERLETFCKKSGFSDVEHNYRLSASDNRYQIDVICGAESNVVLIECKTVYKDSSFPESSDNIKTFTELLNGRREEYIRLIKADSKYSKYKNIFLVLALSPDFKVTETQRNLAKKVGVEIWDDTYTSYYEEQPVILREVTLHNILADLGAKVPGDSVHTIIAFKTKINIGGVFFEAYSFNINPREIIKYCYVARRGSGQEDYYQRIIDSSRLSSVAKYIEKGGSFVNNIILAHDPLADKETLVFTSINDDLKKKVSEDLIQKLKNEEYNLDFGVLQFPLSYKSFWVIDGQHRLFGYLAIEDKKIQETATVPVVMISQIPVENQMKLFVDINHKQKTINADLIWDILGDIEPMSEDGIISNLVKNLDEKGELATKIKIPSRRSRAPINLSSLCRAIKKTSLLKENIRWIERTKNPFYKNGDMILGSKLLEGALQDYFLVLREKFDIKFTELILNSTAIEVFIALFALLTINIKNGDSSNVRINKLSSWLEYIKLNLSENDIGEIKKATGEALKDDKTRQLFQTIALGTRDENFMFLNKQIDRESKGYERFESMMREWLSNLFGRYSEDGLSFNDWLSGQCPQGFSPEIYNGLKKKFANKDPHRAKNAGISDYLDLGNIRYLITANQQVKDYIRKSREEFGTMSSDSLVGALIIINPERNMGAHDTPTVYDPLEMRLVRNNMDSIIESISRMDNLIEEDDLIEEDVI